MRRWLVIANVDGLAYIFTLRRRRPRADPKQSRDTAILP